jgi:cysteine desulfurase
VTSELIYLDYNATTPLDPRVRQRMMPFLEHEYGNPASRDHAFGWNAADAVEEARYHVAELISAGPIEIVFTGGATEAINLALKGLVGAPRSAVKRLITSPTEHEAVLGVCRQLAKLDGVAVEYLPVDWCALTSASDLARALADGAGGLVAIMAANNEIGTINPIRELAASAHAARALFFTDATQAVGKIPVDVRDAGVDLLAFSAHKLYGPKGVGALFIRAGEPKVELEPIILGGGHERGLRAGTLNVAGIVGFGEACRLAKLELEAEAERVAALRDAFEGRLREGIPSLIVNGADASRLPNTTSVTVSGEDARILLRAAWQVAASTKSACASGDAGPSHVLTAIGLSAQDAYGSIRFSLGRFTTRADVDEAATRFVAAVRPAAGTG